MKPAHKVALWTYGVMTVSVAAYPPSSAGGSGSRSTMRIRRELLPEREAQAK